MYAQQFVPSGLTAVLIATTPFWTALLERALPGGERFPARALAGLSLGFSGIVTLVWPQLTDGGASGRAFVFEHTSPSVSASSVRAVLSAVEHFINAELAVLKVFSWIEDARKRSRPDLADKYTQRLADLVQNASYSETIERRKKALG